MTSAQSLRARFKATVTEAILDAAEELAAADGVPATNLQAVAKRAGVAVGTIYNHFEDRDELFAELYARRRDELFTQLDAAGASVEGADFDTQLDAFARTVLGFFDTRRAFLRLGLDGRAPKPAPRKKGASAAQSSMDQLTARAALIVRVGLEEKRLRAEVADLAPIALTGLLRAVLVARAADPRPLVDEAARVIALFLRGASR